MKRLSPKQILLIHDELIEQYGGSHGIRDENLLESAIYQPFASYGGIDLYPTIFDKTAALLRSIINNHPFIDGNKRTAIASVQIILEESGFIFNASVNLTYKFLNQVASQNLSIKKIVSWLKNKTIPA
ncbi:MAG: type II toxin-antitoxin system death-on-curing family toxin [Patescibacteria group bacterium]|nr:type II toxin-antitoxin system death-on-curing family toxin [Patescibacteria group bacterium]